jgi:hypothetical protein
MTFIKEIEIEGKLENNFSLCTTQKLLPAAAKPLNGIAPLPTAHLGNGFALVVVNSSARVAN